MRCESKREGVLGVRAGFRASKEMPIDLLMHMTRLESWCWGVRALRLNDFHRNRTDRSARSRGTQHMFEQTSLNDFRDIHT